jgi:hypothetical protein
MKDKELKSLMEWAEKQNRFALIRTSRNFQRKYI